MDDYIAHHGIKGMHWGIRRTPEQLGHKPSRKKEEKPLLRPEPTSTTTSAKSFYRQKSRYTNDELKQINERKKLESELRKYMNEEIKKPDVQKYATIGKTIMDSIQSGAKAYDTIITARKKRLSTP